METCPSFSHSKYMEGRCVVKIEKYILCIRKGTLGLALKSEGSVRVRAVVVSFSRSLVFFNFRSRVIL